VGNAPALSKRSVISTASLPRAPPAPSRQTAIGVRFASAWCGRRSGCQRHGRCRLGDRSGSPEAAIGFIPFFIEDYYLLIKREAAEQKNIADLIDILKNNTFRALVSSIPGYDATEAGVLKTIGEAA
jgi:hypothetical protein